MRQQVLSIEQMKHLQELGLDTSNASMLWQRKTRFFNGKANVSGWVLDLNIPIILIDYDEIELIPTFTLQDILELLPTNISSEEQTWPASLHIDYEKYLIAYGNTDREDLEIFHSEQINHKDFDVSVDIPHVGKATLNAAYEMLCWCIENGYVPTKTKQNV